MHPGEPNILVKRRDNVTHSFYLESRDNSFLDEGEKEVFQNGLFWPLFSTIHSLKPCVGVIFSHGKLRAKPSSFVSLPPKPVALWQGKAAAAFFGLPQSASPARLHDTFPRNEAHSF